MNNLISSFYHKYTKSELKIAEFVVNNDISYKSIVELAKEIGVGEATILRFCKKIGFTGFYDFKIAYIKGQNGVEENENADLIDRVSNKYTELISLAKERITLTSVEKSANYIRNAKDIVIFGVGNSGITARQAEAALQRRAYLARSVEDPHFQSILASTLTKDSLVIAISLSGYTTDIIESVTIAKNSGARIIAITNFEDSALGHLADCKILTASKENPLEGGALSSKISQLFALDLLFNQLDTFDLNSAEVIKEKTAKAISKKIVY